MIKYKLFPTIEEIFVNPTYNHHAVFFPLLSVDLKSIDKGEGTLHFISYFRDGEDDIIHDKNFSYNFMRFKIIGNKYRFDGDFKTIYMFESSIKWYEEAKEIYKKYKHQYIINSDFVKNEDKRRLEINFEYYYYIKGVLNYWVTRDKYLETDKFIQGSAYTYGNSNQEREHFTHLGEEYDDGGFRDEILEETLNELGIDFKSLDLIGCLAGYNYLEFGADEISLFLDKNQKEVFLYYNWS